MHETILHRHSPNRWMASPTCMLICLLNLPFMFCIHFLSLFLSLSVAMHFIDLLSFSFPSMSWASLGPGSAFTKVTLHNLGKEGSPSSLDLCIPAHHQTPWLNCAFLEVSGCLAQNFCKFVPGPASFPSRIAHCAIPVSNCHTRLCIAQFQQSFNLSAA